MLPQLETAALQVAVWDSLCQAGWAVPRTGLFSDHRCRAIAQWQGMPCSRPFSGNRISSCERACCSRLARTTPPPSSHRRIQCSQNSTPKTASSRSSRLSSSSSDGSGRRARTCSGPTMFLCRAHCLSRANRRSRQTGMAPGLTRSLETFIISRYWIPSSSSSSSSFGSRLRISVCCSTITSQCRRHLQGSTSTHSR